MREDVEMLCSEAFEGRSFNSGGTVLPSIMLARRFAEAGLAALPSGRYQCFRDAQVTVLRRDTGSVNDRSAVLSIRFGESTALLTADIAGGTQHYLADEDPSRIKADVLKAPHHGITAMVSEFLTAVDPGFILGACYEKDAGALIIQARHRDIPMYCAGQGRVTLVTDGTDWYIWQQKKEF